jgi:hypothetical protein
MANSSEYVEIECSRERETDAAVLIVVDGEEVWLPLSQIESMHFDARNEGTVRVASWLARKKGLI